MARGDLAAAELDIKTALQKNPDNAQARSLYGQLYFSQSNPGAAIGEFERALRSAPRSDTRLWLAKALVLAGESAELLSAIDRREYAMLARDPEFAAVQARAHLGQAEFEAARESLAQAETLSGESNDYIDVTRALFALQLDGDREAAASILAAVTNRSPDDAHAWSLRGVIANASGDRAAAEEYFARAAEANPYRLGDRLQLINTQLRQGKSAEASQELARLEKLIPNYPAVNFLRGQLHYDDGDYESALESLARVLTASPNHAGALLLAANANVRENNLATAQRQLTQFLAQYPGNLQAGLQLGSLYLQLREPENAERVARETLKEHAMNTRVLGLLAMSLAAQGMHAESAQTYEQIASLQPESTSALVALGSQQVVAGETGEGIERLQAAVALEPENTAARERLIEALLAIKDLDAAAAATDAYLAQDPEAMRAFVYRGRVQLMQNQLNEARESFERALQLEPGNAAANSGMAALAILDEDYEGAKAAFQKGLDANPGDLRASMNLAVLHEQAGDLQAMADVLNVAMDANPNAPEPRLALARLALREGRPGDAIGLLTAIEESNAGDFRIQQALAGAYLAAEQPLAAAASARELLVLRPEDPTSLALAARVESANGRPEQAQQHLEKALVGAPESSELRMMLIEALVSQRKLEQAGAEIGKLPEAVQQEAPMVVLRGRLAMARGDAVAAKALFEQAFVAQRTNVNLALLTRSRWALGERDAAIAAVRTWLEEYPQDALTRNELAGLELQRGNEAAAIVEYQRLLEQQPNSALALNNLAWLVRTSDTQAALDYARRADDLAPESPAIKDTFAMVELAAGNPRRALALNDKALAGAPGNPDISFHRAQILVAAEREDEAEALLRDLVAGPDFAGKADARALLESLRN